MWQTEDRQTEDRQTEDGVTDNASTREACPSKNLWPRRPRVTKILKTFGKLLTKFHKKDNFPQNKDLLKWKVCLLFILYQKIVNFVLHIMWKYQKNTRLGCRRKETFSNVRCHTISRITIKLYSNDRPAHMDRHCLLTKARRVKHMYTHFILLRGIWRIHCSKENLQIYLPTILFKDLITKLQGKFIHLKVYYSDWQWNFQHFLNNNVKPMVTTVTGNYL